jgi:hypothetical protein
MFEDLVVSGANPTKTNKSWTVLLSTLIQLGIVVVMILIPLIYTQAAAHHIPGGAAASASPAASRCGHTENREARGAPDSQRPDDGSHRHPQKS